MVDLVNMARPGPERCRQCRSIQAGSGRVSFPPNVHSSPGDGSSAPKARRRGEHICPRAGAIVSRYSGRRRAETCRTMDNTLSSLVHGARHWRIRRPRLPSQRASRLWRHRRKSSLQAARSTNLSSFSSIGARPSKAPLEEDSAVLPPWSYRSSPSCRSAPS
jgi:hypothetical protein